MRPESFRDKDTWPRMSAIFGRNSQPHPFRHLRRLSPAHAGPRRYGAHTSPKCQVPNPRTRESAIEPQKRTEGYATGFCLLSRQFAARIPRRGQETAGAIGDASVSRAECNGGLRSATTANGGSTSLGRLARRLALPKKPEMFGSSPVTSANKHAAPKRPRSRPIEPGRGASSRASNWRGAPTMVFKIHSNAV